MFSLKQAVVVIVALLASVAAAAGMAERVTVRESGYTRENAIMNAAQAAVRTVLEKYMASDAADKNKELVDQILDNSTFYLSSINISDEEVDEEGIVEITAEAVVNVDKLVTTLRNLDVALILPTISEKFVWRVR